MNNRKTLEELTKEFRKISHHSTADWDYSNTNWLLDNARYHSAPSSWRPKLGGVGVRALVKTTVIPISYVKEGKITTWIRFNTGLSWQRVWLILRWQDTNNYYRCSITRDSALPPPNQTWYSIDKISGGVGSSMVSITVPTLPTNTWLHFRTSWWNDAVGLVIRFEKENGSWTKVLPDGYDSENLWKDIGGRVGFDVIYNQETLYVNIDDTEICGKPS